MKTESAPFSKRAHPRVRVAMPVHVAALEGVTRDISAGGIYFELDGDAEAVCEICFEVEMNTALGSLFMQCCGRVVRKEARGGWTGIAVRMTDSHIEVLS